jgi:hypothetical protein
MISTVCERIPVTENREFIGPNREYNRRNREITRNCHATEPHAYNIIRCSNSNAKSYSHKIRSVSKNSRVFPGRYRLAEAAESTSTQSASSTRDLTTCPGRSRQRRRLVTTFPLWPSASLLGSSIVAWYVIMVSYRTLGFRPLATRGTAPPQSQSANLTGEQMRRGIEQLKLRIADLGSLTVGRLGRRRSR